MKKIFKRGLSCFILCMMLITSLNVFAKEEIPEIKSGAAVLMDFKSGRVLYEENADEKSYPASTTKIMTAILAIENLEYTKVLTASETAIDIERDGSNMGILKDEQFTVEQLLYGLLVHSANDAANVLAEGVSGNISDFVVLMNKKAKELGMENTHFVNPHGYHNEDHYMSAGDLAILSAYAMKNEKFAQIASTPTYELPPTEKYPHIRYLSSNNMLINPMKGRTYLYEYAKGIKTGYTSNAGSCLASFAEKGDISYICVVMNAPTEGTDTYSFIDTINLFNYGFNNYKLKTITSNSDEILATAPVKWSKDGENVSLTTNISLEVLLPVDFKEEDLIKKINIKENIKAPVKKGEVLGTIEYVYEDISLGKINLIATKDTRRSNSKMIFGTIFDFIFSAWVMVPFFSIVVVLFIIRSYNLKKRRKMREMRRRQNRDMF